MMTKVALFVRHLCHGLTITITLSAAASAVAALAVATVAAPAAPAPAPAVLAAVPMAAVISAFCRGDTGCARQDIC